MNLFLKPVALLLALVLGPVAQAGELVLNVTDQQGTPLENAVVSLAGPPAGASAPATANMDQRDKMFSPHVLAVHTGTAVSFPNRDNIRHQVYSFSPVKRFELRLYEGTPTAPVIFDQPGVVVLGCNIHDWMLGYIYVTPDPWFAVTDAQGHAVFKQLPEGTYIPTLWHPRRADLRPQLIDSLKVAAAPLNKTLALTVEPASDDAPTPPASAFGDAFGKALREEAK
jgi:plastocyanin